MAVELPDWPREHFQHDGGRPFLFYVVYGTFGAIPSLSSSHYRSNGIPDGFELMLYDLQRYAEVVASFKDGYLWNELCSTQPDFASQISECEECFILRGEINDGPTLNYLRDVIGLVTFLLDQGGIAVYDPCMFQWWNPTDWVRRIFQPAAAVPRHHVVVLTSQESEAGPTWFHTRGMRKFGRPDLSIHDVPLRLHAAIIDLFERFIEMQAFGATIEEGQKIRMNSLPKGMTCHPQGDLDDPDFNNVHVEIKFAANEHDTHS